MNLLPDVDFLERTTGAVGPPPAVLLPNPDNTPVKCENPRREPGVFTLERTTGFEPATLTLASNTSVPINPGIHAVSGNPSPCLSPSWSRVRADRVPSRYPTMLATIDEAPPHCWGLVALSAPVRSPALFFLVRTLDRHVEARALLGRYEEQRLLRSLEREVVLKGVLVVSLHRTVDEHTGAMPTGRQVQRWEGALLIGAYVAIVPFLG